MSSIASPQMLRLHKPTDRRTLSDLQASKQEPTVVAPSYSYCAEIDRVRVQAFPHFFSAFWSMLAGGCCSEFPTHPGHGGGVRTRRNFRLGGILPARRADTALPRPLPEADGRAEGGVVERGRGRRKPSLRSRQGTKKKKEALQ